MTKEIALTHKGIIYIKNKFNADKTQMRCRVNGKCKTWKTRPLEFSLPVKHELYDYGYITHDYGYITHDNMNEFYIEV